MQASRFEHSPCGDFFAFHSVFRDQTAIWQRSSPGGRSGGQRLKCSTLQPGCDLPLAAGAGADAGGSFHGASEQVSSAIKLYCGELLGFMGDRVWAV